jgi:hypothetical protein
MPHQFCKNNAGKIFPAWERNKEDFSIPNINLFGGIEKYKQLRDEVINLNWELKEEQYAIIVDEKTGPHIIEKKDLPIEMQRYLRPFPIKFQ